jgi:glycosyltransferase involved in cell wall biosynthesis
VRDDMNESFIFDKRVLVLIPSYNHGRFVKERVRSVLDQSYTNIDVYVIDDGSNDTTMDVLVGIFDPRLKISQRERNSGSPFTAWIDACAMIDRGDYDFIWIAESDDFAHKDFLLNGIKNLQKYYKSVLYYCHSWFVNENSLIIGHSINYLNKNFFNTNWNSPWMMSGQHFIKNCLFRGMAVPNMSSALMRASAFRQAMRDDFIRFKLAADWLFVIEIAKLGGVVFEPWDGNYFRHHARTSRSETKDARMVFEHMAAIQAAYHSGAVDRRDYVEHMRIWAGIYREKGVKLRDFVSIGRQISIRNLFHSLLFIKIISNF